MIFGGSIKRAIGRLAPKYVVVNGSSDIRSSLALTFDDGPDPLNTPRILDVLEEQELAATFFLQGNKAESLPALVREIVARGHQVANHSYSHFSARSTGRSFYVNDVLRAQDVLENIVGQALPRYFRPPFGHVSVTTFIALIREGFCFVFWSVDSMDSHLLDQSALVASMAKQSLVAGDILLFHDDYTRTADALFEVTSNLRTRGYRLTSVGGLLRASSLATHNRI